LFALTASDNDEAELVFFFDVDASVFFDEIDVASARPIFLVVGNDLLKTRDSPLAHVAI
jgi:hypothetical protein